MPWTYYQTSGELWLDGALIGDGYSGYGMGKNNPGLQDVKNVGPIPQGIYSIGPAFADGEKGPVVMRLFPHKPTDTLGRSGFLIHGDSIARAGKASEGCIILPHQTRVQISISDDRELEVQA